MRERNSESKMDEALLSEERESPGHVSHMSLNMMESDDSSQSVGKETPTEEEDELVVPLTHGSSLRVVTFNVITSVCHWL